MNLFRWLRRWLRPSEPTAQPRPSVIRRVPQSGRPIRGNAVRPFQSRPVRGNAA